MDKEARKRYPANWEDIVWVLRVKRARDRCEWCGRPNSSTDGAGKRHVLTVAHLGIRKPDGSPGSKTDTMDCRPENLAVLCDVCHLQFDTRTRTDSPGQLELPGFEMPPMPRIRCPRPVSHSKEGK